MSLDSCLLFHNIIVNVDPGLICGPAGVKIVLNTVAVQGPGLLFGDRVW